MYTRVGISPRKNTREILFLSQVIRILISRAHSHKPLPFFKVLYVCMCSHSVETTHIERDKRSAKCILLTSLLKNGKVEKRELPLCVSVCVIPSFYPIISIEK